MKKLQLRNAVVLTTCAYALSFVHQVSAEEIKDNDLGYDFTNSTEEIEAIEPVETAAVDAESVSNDDTEMVENTDAVRYSAGFRSASDVDEETDSFEESIVEQNKWIENSAKQQWEYRDAQGNVLAHMNNDGYWVNGEKKFDTVLKVSDDKYYYFGDKSLNGQLIRNNWAYSTKEQKWHYGQNDGTVVSTLSKDGYWKFGVQYADVVVEIKDKGYYYVQNWDKGGKLSVNQWAYSSREQKWHQSNASGMITATFGKNGYWVNGRKKFDEVITMPDKTEYYVGGYAANGKLAVNEWSYSNKNNRWYYGNENGKVVSTLDKDGYFINGKQQFDQVIEVPKFGFLYVKDAGQKGKMAINEWAYSVKEKKWHYGSYNGRISSTLSNSGYWIEGKQLFDQVIEVPKIGYFYVEGYNQSGRLSLNKWVYSPKEQKWHQTGANGVITATIGKEGYWVKGRKQYDELVEIPNHGMLFIGGYSDNGALALNKWAYSSKTKTWYYGTYDGKVVSTLGENGYFINENQYYDQIIEIPKVGFFYVKDKNSKGKLAVNEWVYSSKDKKWHYGSANGRISSTLTENSYWVDGKQIFDQVVEIPGKGSFYVEGIANKGIIAKNKWVQSDRDGRWHKVGVDGLIEESFGKNGYWINGVQQFDVLLRHQNKVYFFEPQNAGGKMSVNKWSKSEKAGVWYQSNSTGNLVRKDKTGPILPAYVELDKGQWKMFSLAQDSWHSGCWLRSAASGINSAGGNVTPFSLIEHIKRTDDPRTGMLSHPSITNNWNLGGVYSAMWPEALVPVVKKFVPNAVDLTGASFEDIKRELASGNTVQIYYAWAAPNIRLNGERGTFYGSKDYHSILLTGYNSTGFFHQEHWYGGTRNNHFAYSKLKWQYEAYGSKAISFRKENVLP
ncbi:C39 family peptidase [Aerococcaceae bacterium zg-ZUI334]|uniref:C39 family peptidase n=1 Tax=Aerococcaceae TaxID=186827 RepID=UPI0013BA0963|nr:MULTISPECIES: C39 family peptidase [unclassified Facklamia]MBR7927752.1 C39 family peptidase [Aerococcaceae bacterium zg-ZUI334]NEW64555.1 hypothetical protein [Facklamia sp. 252]NEW67762.1 hypothetical protein [Facklamia sp. 253]QQD65737.1 C39 family peptidase [Aerococcaceae bacterium zg-252]